MAAKGEPVGCLDETANPQALARRRPTRPGRSAHLERREHEYVRHGTATLLAALAAPTGVVWGRCLEANDGASLRPALPPLFPRLARRCGAFDVVCDGGPSCVSAETV